MDTRTFLDESDGIDAPAAWAVAIEVAESVEGPWLNPARWPQFDSLREAIEFGHDEITRASRMFDETQTAYVFTGPTNEGDRLDPSAADFVIEQTTNENGHNLSRITGVGLFGTRLILMAEPMPGEEVFEAEQPDGWGTIEA